MAHEQRPRLPAPAPVPAQSPGWELKAQSRREGSRVSQEEGKKFALSNPIHFFLGFSVFFFLIAHHLSKHSLKSSKLISTGTKEKNTPSLTQAAREGRQKGSRQRGGGGGSYFDPGPGAQRGQKGGRLRHRAVLIEESYKNLPQCPYL